MLRNKNIFQKTSKKISLHVFINLCFKGECVLMQISSINNSNIYKTNHRNAENIRQNNPSFTGLTQNLVSFWQFIENGGRAASFTIEDMGGTNFPRTIMGMFAGFKYTHKLNFASLKQEGIREFLTGPTMTFAPMLILAFMKSAFGKTANTHVSNIRNLSYLADNMVENGEIKEKDFVNKVVADLLEKTSGKKITKDNIKSTDLSKEDVDNLADKLLNYKNLTDAKGKKSKTEKRIIKEQLEDIQQTFSSIIKRTKEDYKNTDFLSAKLSLNENKTITTKFKTYVDYINAYINDFNAFSKKQGKVISSSELIEKFKGNYSAKRLETIFCMVTITAALMSYIPKLYTWASGNVNPNASAIYDEASKTDKRRNA